MFSSIAHRYDFLNRLLSGGRDRYWREKAVDRLNLFPGARFLDLAAGTGDVALEIAKRQDSDMRILASDLTLKMAVLGRKKILNQNLDRIIEFHLSAAENLPYKEKSFDGVTCAFGVRNFADYHIGISEMTRVTNKNGKVVILEFTTPQNKLFRSLYYFYFTRILPLIGGIISGNFDAYSYLPDSVLSFPDREKLKSIMEEAGLKDVSYKNLTFGIVSIHEGTKR